MRKLVRALSVIILVSSCAREVVEPAQQIAGKYVLDDETGLTNEYLEFNKGTLTVYTSGRQSYPLAENKIWDDGQAALRQSSREAYYIQDGFLYSDVLSGPIAKDEEKLTLGNLTFVRLDGFEKDPYSIIQLEKSLYEIPLLEGEYSFPVTVKNPIPTGELTASSSTSWISEVTYKEGMVLYKISTTNTPRTGTITLNYIHAKAAQVTIRQTPATYIRLQETSKTIGYASTQVEIPYTIEGPVEGSELKVSTTAKWIENFAVAGDKVTFNVFENNTGTRRNATLTFSYNGAEDILFELLQEWSASSIVLTPSSATPGYTGGTDTFTFEVQNPREGISCTAASQADWITDVAISGNKVSYKVAENNSYASRIGKVKLIYDVFATAEFSVTQSGKPVTSLTLNKTSLALLTKTSEKLTATVEPSDAPLVWTSGDTSIASVSEGTVTGVGNGTTTITVKSEDGSKSASCTVTVTTAVTGVTLNKTTLSLEVGQNETLTATVSPSTASNKSVTWSSSDNSIAAVDQNGKITAKTKGNTVIKATANDGSGVFASCTVVVKEPYTAVAGEAVDLGLSVKWSSMNLGATSPTGYGDYFAWGETEPYYSSQNPLTWKDGKTGYNWSSYSLCSGSSSTLTRYNNSSSYGIVDNKTEFKDYDYEDDAARKALGSKWRIPTDAEWTELREQCTWTWTTQNGVNGRLVKSKTNGNSIFLPAAGYRYGANLDHVGSNGNYWSSSLSTDYPDNAWGVGFGSDDVIRYGGERYDGFSVRPVSE